MRKDVFRFIAVFISCTIMCFMAVAADDVNVKEISYTYKSSSMNLGSDSYMIAEAIDETSSCAVEYPILPKSNRLRFYAGDVEVDVQGVSPEIRMCAEVAADIWRNAVSNQVPVKVLVTSAGNDSDVDFNTKVKFIYNAESHCYEAQSLYKQTHEGAFEKYDAVFYVNSQRSWDYSVSYKQFPGPNLTSVFLNAFAKAYGMCSSVTSIKDGTVSVGLDRPTRYDSLIVNTDGQTILDFAGDCSAEEYPAIAAEYYAGIKGSVISPDFYLNVGDRRPVVRDPNFVYHVGVLGCIADDGSKYQLISEYEEEIIRALGWQTDTPEDVYCYISNAPYLSSCFWGDENPVVSVTNRSGKEIIEYGSFGEAPLAEGGYEEFKVYSKEDLGKIVGNPLKYRINVNGDLYVKLNCKYSFKNDPTKTGQRCSTTTASLQMKPSVENVRFLFFPDGKDFYDWKRIYFMITHRGSETLVAQLFEDGEMVREKVITNQHYIALDWMYHEFNPDHKYSLKVTAFNHAGSGSGEYVITNGEDAGIEEVNGDAVAAYDHVMVYDLNGVRMGEFSNLSDCGDLQTGIYIAVFMAGDQILKREKFRL